MEPLLTESDFRRRGYKGYVFCGLMVLPIVFSFINLILVGGIISELSGLDQLSKKIDSDVNSTLFRVNSMISSVDIKFDGLSHGVRNDVQKGLREMSLSAKNVRMDINKSMSEVTTRTHEEIKKSSENIEKYFMSNLHLIGETIAQNFLNDSVVRRLLNKLNEL